jgi:hypothetical protein
MLSERDIPWDIIDNPEVSIASSASLLTKKSPLNFSI